MAVEVWFDYLCPWCYLATERVSYLRDTHGLTVEWRPFELHPEIPPGGTELAVRPGSGRAVRELAAAAGLPLGSRRRSNNTRIALALSAWASSSPGWDRLHDRMFSAYWVDGVDLEDPDLLVDLAAASGIERGAAHDAVASGAGLEVLHASKAEALDLGVGATPGWHFGNGVVFTGIHPDHVMDRIVAANR